MASPLSVFTCLSPALLPHFHLEGCTAVVIDVMRATSAMVTGLGEGVEAFRPVARLEEARQALAQGHLAAAERGGLRVEGFPLGNSPRQYLKRAYAGRTIVATTSNGTRTLHAASAAAEVRIAAFLNLQAVVDVLRVQRQPVVLVCAGWKNHFSLEDTLLAGAIAQGLAPAEAQQDDATLMARQLYREATTDLEGALRRSSHFRRLAEHGSADDLPFCLARDRYPVVPLFRGGEVFLPDNVPGT